MARGLLAERVRRDIEVVARAGLDLDTFASEALASLSRAVPAVAACLASVDPSTRLVTSARKYGDLLDQDSHDHEWGLHEYGDLEPSSFVELVDRGTPAVAVHLMTGGRIEESPRMERFMRKHFGYRDELRAVGVEAGQVWGSLALFRGEDDEPFSAEEVDLVGSLSRSLAMGLRGGLLASLAGSASPGRVQAEDTGPLVIIIGPDDAVRQVNRVSDERLDLIWDRGPHSAPDAVVGGLVGAARRFARGETDVPPRCRIRGRHGTWWVLHAAPLTGVRGQTGEVVVTIEEARPPEVVPLVVAAFGLTPRERDVTEQVLQGVDTKEIARSMHVSPYTVQDHLKAVFDKAGVRSRRELMARVYFDQYVPRMGSELGPSGWFTAG